MVNRDGTDPIQYLYSGSDSDVIHYWTDVTDPRTDPDPTCVYSLLALTPVELVAEMLTLYAGLNINTCSGK